MMSHPDHAAVSNAFDKIIAHIRDASNGLCSFDERILEDVSSSAFRKCKSRQSFTNRLVDTDNTVQCPAILQRKAYPSSIS